MILIHKPVSRNHHHQSWSDQQPQPSHWATPYLAPVKTIRFVSRMFKFFPDSPSLISSTYQSFPGVPLIWIHSPWQAHWWSYSAREKANEPKNTGGKTRRMLLEEKVPFRQMALRKMLQVSGKLKINLFVRLIPNSTFLSQSNHSKRRELIGKELDWAI